MATRKQTTKCGKWECSSKLASKFNINFDHIFYRLGRLLGLHPRKTICASLLVCVLAGLGLILWHEELNDVELFMPMSSHVRADAAWVQENFQDGLRFESVIVEADNVLQPNVLSAIEELETAVKMISVSGHSWEDVCARYQSWFQDSDEPFNTSGWDEYLEKVDMESFPNDCIYQSMLKLWPLNSGRQSISNMKKYDILNKVTHYLNDSKPKNILEDIGPLLSGVQWSSDGKVIGAKATILNWMLRKSDSSSPDWELEFIQQALYSNRSLPSKMKIFAVSSRSYKDVLQQVLENNQTLLFAGFSLIIFYVIIMLGGCNLVDQRIYLSLLAVSVVGQSILASYGLCFCMGFFWGPLHPVLPFLLLGIGVDNIFVIVQCLDNLKQTGIKMDVPERIGRALQQGGVSITVTSLTDILAFAVGTSTVMPFLRSFCVFAATGIFCLYVFEIFFFVSCLSLDERRLESRRDCLFRKHDNWKPNECSKRSIQKMFFSNCIAPTLMKTPIKIFILVITVVIFSVNMWCVFQVEQKFDPIWYLNPDSYPIKFNDKLNEYFPQYGKRAAIYMGGINFFEDKDQLNELASRLESNPYINTASLDIWYKKFDDWLVSKEFEPENEEEYKAYLTEFLLLTVQGQAYIKDIKFKNFMSTEYNITASQIPIQHIVMDTTEEQVKAMTSVWEIIHSLNFTSDSAHIVAFSPDYVSWTANKIIGEELLRNLGLTIAAVVMVTLGLIQNLQTTLWVNCCVIFTVVDLVGSMHWLGLTIEISTSIMVLLCAGLAVDYSAHIGHEFTRLQGTRNERAIKTVSLIGCAIFNGGLSTFLAFCLLGSSDSYLFTTFFKLFTGVVVFGLFHGLLFLPVVLSLFGPQSKQDLSSTSTNSIKCQKQNGIAQVRASNKEDESLPTEEQEQAQMLHTSTTNDPWVLRDSETVILSSLNELP